MTGPLSGAEVAKALLSDHHPLDAFRARKAWRHLGQDTAKWRDFINALPTDRQDDVIALMQANKQ